MRFQIFLVLILFSVCISVLFTLVLTNSQYTSTLDQRRADLNSQGQALANSIVTSGYLTATKTDTAEWSNLDTQITMLADVYNGRIVVVDKGLRVIRDTYRLEQGKTIISGEAIQGLKGQGSSYLSTKRQYMEIIIPITDTTKQETVGVLIMSFSVQDLFQLHDAMQTRANILIVTVIIIAVLFAILVSGRMSAPFRQITRSINHLTEGYLDDTVEVIGFTETREVSDAFNKMTKRLNVLENSRQQFVSNVSHELKTPITSMKVLADSLLSQKDTPVEMYQEFMVDITKEIDRENKIINDLLSMVRMDQKTGTMTVENKNMNELVEDTMKRLRPIAEERNIELIYESFRQVEAEVDETKFSMALNNLIENAVKYNNDGGFVRVSLNADHKFFYIKVEDNGVGIPEEEQEHIFERFYRVDKARSRETGGTGLGLSITKNIVLMHRGALKVYSRPGEGTTFTMRIPLKYVAAARKEPMA